MASDLENPQPSRESLIPPTAGVWDYVSPSRLKMWLACPLKFKLKYIEGLPTPTSPAAFLGKIVHQGLEHYYRNRQLDVTLAHDEVVGRTLAGWSRTADEERMVFETVADERALQGQAAALLQTYLLQVRGTEPRPLAVEAVLESPLIDLQNGEDLGLPLVGIVDLVLPDEDGPLIIDFKSAARSTESLEVLHDIQLSCYAYLLRSNASVVEGGLEIRRLIKTKTPKIEFHRYAARNQKHFGRLLAVVRAYLDDLDTGRFLFRPGFGCAMCEFRRTCIAQE